MNWPFPIWVTLGVFLFETVASMFHKRGSQGRGEALIVLSWAAWFVWTYGSFAIFKAAWVLVPVEIFSEARALAIGLGLIWGSAALAAGVLFLLAPIMRAVRGRR